MEKEKAHAEGMYGILCTCKANIYMICIKNRYCKKKSFFSQSVNITKIKKINSSLEKIQKALIVT